VSRGMHFTNVASIMTQADLAQASCEISTDNTRSQALSFTCRMNAIILCPLRSGLDYYLQAYCEQWKLVLSSLGFPALCSNATGATQSLYSRLRRNENKRYAPSIADTIHLVSLDT